MKNKHGNCNIFAMFKSAELLAQVWLNVVQAHFVINVHIWLQFKFPISLFSIYLLNSKGGGHIILHKTRLSVG